MNKRNNPITAEILIEILKRSSLNSVLIEGQDDLVIYRKMEKEINDPNLSFLPCGGRTALLRVYERKHECGNNKKLFICDSDLWVFLGRPINFDNDLISTEGYSIENELFQDGKELLIKLLNDEEKGKFYTLVKNVCKWFAFEIEKVYGNNQHDCEFSKVSLLNPTIIKRNSIDFCEDFLIQRNYIEPSSAMFNDIHEGYSIKLRGKYLFQIFEKIFLEREDIGFKREQLFELIYKFIVPTNDTSYVLTKRKNQIVEFFN